MCVTVCVCVCDCVCVCVVDIMNICIFLVWTKSQTVLHILHSSINHCLLSNDLVLDAAVLIWEGCGPLYNSVLSHDIVSSCKPLLTSTGKVTNTIIHKHLLLIFQYHDLSISCVVHQLLKQVIVSI